MEENIKGFLLEFGDIVIDNLRDDILFYELPINSWQVDFSVENTTLKFNVVLQYDILLNTYLNMVSDPLYWISIIAFKAGTLLSELDMNTLSEVRIGIQVNDRNQNKNLIVSCSLPILIDAILNDSPVQGYTISTEARIMSIMEW